MNKGPVSLPDEYQEIEELILAVFKEIKKLRKAEMTENKQHQIQLNATKKQLTDTTQQLNTKIIQLKTTKTDLELKLSQAYRMINQLVPMQKELENQLKKARSGMASRAIKAVRSGIMASGAKKAAKKLTQQQPLATARKAVKKLTQKSLAQQPLAQQQPLSAANKTTAIKAVNMFRARKKS